MDGMMGGVVGMKGLEEVIAKHQKYTFQETEPLQCFFEYLDRLSWLHLTYLF
jgi:hypothetical protein